MTGQSLGAVHRAANIRAAGGMTSPAGRPDATIADAPSDEPNGGPPYFAFPKPLCDALVASSMPAAHLRVVLAVLRLTIGHYNRPAARVSYDTIVRRTGMHERTVRRSWTELRKAGVLLVLSPHRGRLGTLVGIAEPSAWGTYAPSVECAEPRTLQTDVDESLGAPLRHLGCAARSAKVRCGAHPLNKVLKNTSKAPHAANSGAGDGDDRGPNERLADRPACVACGATLTPDDMLEGDCMADGWHCLRCVSQAVRND